MGIGPLPILQGERCLLRALVPADARITLVLEKVK